MHHNHNNRLSGKQLSTKFLSIELHKKFTQPDPFVSGPGVLSSSEKYISFDGPAQRTYQPSEGTTRSLTVDIEACDQSISKRMIIYNVETTYDINYHTGETRQ